MDQNSEKLLLAKIAIGDVSALNVVFNKYYTQLVLFSDRFLEDRQEVEDMVSEVFIKFWEKRDRAIEIKNLSSYLFRCVKNGSIDILRRRSKLTVEENVETSLLDDIGEKMEQEEIYAMVIQQVYEAVEQLPQQSKSILKLFFFEGRNTNEIADLLKISVQSVRNQKNRALALLRRRIKDPDLLLIVLLSIAYEYTQKK